MSSKSHRIRQREAKRRRDEAERLTALADEIEAKIPLYEDRRPELAEQARGTVAIYRQSVKDLTGGASQ